MRARSLSGKVHGLVLLTLCLLNAVACSVIHPPAAEVEIIEWQQLTFLGSPTDVRIDYRITNTGDVPISYYQVWFEIECVDGTSFQEWDNGSDVAVGQYLTDHTYVDVMGKRATTAKIVEVELTSY